MSSKQTAPQAPEPEERVITIGWQVVILPLVLLLVVALGFVVGRQMSVRSAARMAAAVASPVAPGSVIQIAPQDSGAVQVVPQNPVTTYDPNTVYELPRRPHPLLGKPAPDFTMTLLDTGQEVKLSDYKGHPVVLDFWATWCPPCRFEMPWLQQLYVKHGNDGLVVLGFDVGEKVAPEMAEQTIKQFVSMAGISFPVLVGPETPNLQAQAAYNVQGYPTLFIIDKDGTVVDFNQGMFPNYVTLESRVSAILPEGAAKATGVPLPGTAEGVAAPTTSTIGAP